MCCEFTLDQVAEGDNCVTCSEHTHTFTTTFCLVYHTPLAVGTHPHPPTPPHASADIKQIVRAPRTAAKTHTHTHTHCTCHTCTFFPAHTHCHTPAWHNINALPKASLYVVSSVLDSAQMGLGDTHTHLTRYTARLHWNSYTHTHTLPTTLLPTHIPHTTHTHTHATPLPLCRVDSGSIYHLLPGLLLYAVTCRNARHMRLHAAAK